jgi:HTH-type transcriptional regulator/antitoxin HigA
MGLVVADLWSIQNSTTLTLQRCLMNLKPIRTEDDHHEALQEIEKLWGAKAGTPWGDRLDVLVTLVEAYEREHHPMGPPDPIDAIRFRLEQLGQDQRALIGVIGSLSRMHEVMNGDRGFSLTMIRRLNEKFGIPAEVLIRPTRKREGGHSRGWRKAR